MFINVCNLQQLFKSRLFSHSIILNDRFMGMQQKNYGRLSINSNSLLKLFTIFNFIYQFFISLKVKLRIDQRGNYTSIQNNLTHLSQNLLTLSLVLGQQNLILQLLKTVVNVILKLFIGDILI